MKKINVAFACGVLLTLACTINSYAQDGKDFALTNFSGIKQTANFSFPENDLSSNVDNDKSKVKVLKAKLREAKVNNRVIGYVSNHFKEVSGLQVSVIKNDAILAKFKMNNKSAKIVYDKKGNWIYTIINYQEDDLPGSIKSLVKDSFRGYSITLVQEISQDDITCYKVFLENSQKSKQLMVYNDEITVLQEFQK